MFGDVEKLYEILSGERKAGIGGSALRTLLKFLSLPYSLAVRERERLYSCGLFKKRKVERPVISVGNLTVGGTGKTPLVGWLCQKITEMGMSAGVLTRGYGEDEVGLLREYGAGEVLVGKDRISLAEKAEGVDCFVLDDGFQYLELERDLDIVLIDATNPFGFGELLPRGLLREPVEALRRADAVVLTRVDLAGEQEGLCEEIERFSGKAPIACVSFIPVCLRNGEGRELEVEFLKGKVVGTFCGIGNPRSFHEAVSRLGADVVLRRSFPDHYRFKPDELDRLIRQAEERGAEVLVTTEKDAMRLGGSLPERTLVLASRLDFLRGEDELLSLVREVLERC